MGVIVLDDLDVLVQLDLLAGLAADAEVPGLVFSQMPMMARMVRRMEMTMPTGARVRKKTGRGRSRPHSFGEDGGEELHPHHAQQRADGVEDGEQRALLGVVGQNGQAGTGCSWSGKV